MNVLEILMRHRRLLAIVALTAAVLGYSGSFLMETRYRATAELLVVQPKVAGALTQLSNRVSGALGIPLGEGPSALELYRQYLMSRDLLERAVKVELPLRDDDATTLLDVWGGDKDHSSERRLVKAVQKLGDHLQVESSPGSGTLEISVDTPDPVASAHLANLFVKYLNEFDSEVNDWSTKNRVQALRIREEAVMRELQVEEDSLVSFRISNRDLSNPRLNIEDMRLLRKVGISSEILKSIRVEEELAAIGTGPILKTIEHASIPLEPSWPRRARIAFVLMIIVLILVSYALVVNSVYHAKQAKTEA